MTQSGSTCAQSAGECAKFMSFDTRACYLSRPHTFFSHAPDKQLLIITALVSYTTKRLLLITTLRHRFCILTSLSIDRQKNAVTSAIRARSVRIFKLTHLFMFWNFVLLCVFQFHKSRRSDNLFAILCNQAEIVSFRNNKK